MTRVPVQHLLWGMAVVTALGLPLALPFARADLIVTTGMQPWEICASCHSLDGISAMARFPKLAGQRADYIVKQVRDFRDGHRQNDGGQMVAIAGDTSDDDLAKSAGYFAGLPAPPPDASQATDSEDWLRGATLYRDGDGVAGITGCGFCHEPASARNDAPLLKAQHAAYLEKQLQDWRSGARNNDPSWSMPEIARKLSDRDIAALAWFLASQPRDAANARQAQ
jgi:cytochrome c553